ncbi:hypothetical protein BDZ97DRAFT_1092564 [Flammula alnicola]|nr:hypothetical protein BDZ97DRAFT_1092564 [Flammula alnicola]
MRRTLNAADLQSIHSSINMKYFAAVAALVSVVPRIVSLTINTPSSVVQCEPQLLSWAEGTGPYYLSIIPGGQAGAAPIKTFDTQSGTSMTWRAVDIPAGTSITCVLKDSTGNTAYTDKVNVQQGSDSSCLNGGSSAASLDTISSANAGAVSAPVATQAADATSAGTVNSTGTTQAAVGTGTGATTARATPSVGQAATQTPSRPVGTPVAGTTSAPRPATTNISGAESRFSIGGFGFAGFLGLLGPCSCKSFFDILLDRTEILDTIFRILIFMTFL